MAPGPQGNRRSSVFSDAHHDIGFDDQLAGELTTAHPHHDPVEQSAYKEQLALREPYVVLLYADDQDPDLGYVKSVMGSRYFERSEHVDAFKQAFERVRVQSVDLEEYPR